MLKDYLYDDVWHRLDKLLVLTFWGLIASFWIGNILLVILNVPMIGLWVKLLSIPYRYLFPSAMFFVCIGIYAANNDMFQVGETLAIGILGYILLGST